jgi:hypothetical protein
VGRVVVLREKVGSEPSRTGSAEGRLETIHWRVSWPGIVDGGDKFGGEMGGGE